VIESLRNYLVCATAAQVGNCRGLGTHVFCTVTGTTPGIPSAPDTWHSWPV